MDVTINDRRAFSQVIVDSLASPIDVCKKQLGVHTFGYRRFLADGRSFGFSDNHSWNEICLEQFVGKNILEYEKDLNHSILSGETHLMRKGTPDMSSPFVRALYDCNIWNTLCFYKKDPNHAFMEAFFFAAGRNDCNIINVYMDKLNFIEDWVSLVQRQMATFFDDEASPLFSTTITNTDCLKNLATFLTEKIVIDPTSFFMALSRREQEIVSLLKRGYKRRYMAIKLDIAPKTVDTYFERIKNKTNMLSKNQFLRFLEEIKD